VHKLLEASPAKRCGWARASKVACFGLLAFIAFHPVGAAGQTRCDGAVATIVAAEGEVSVGTEHRLANFVGNAGDSSLCPGESIFVGHHSRAAIRLENTGQIIRLDQGTTVTIMPPGPQGRPLLELANGWLQLLSPGGEPLDVKTPYVTAGVEGTEFFVAVDRARQIARVGVIEGRVVVEAADRTRLILDAGGAAQAGAHEKLHTIPIAPRDQVRWAIYYPPVMWEMPAPGTVDPRIERAWQAWRAGDLTAAIAQTDKIAAATLDPRSRDYLGAILLSVGRTDEAGGFLGCPDRSSGASAPTAPATPRAHALCAIVAVARNRPEEAEAQAARAVALDPSGSAPRVAQSYALQAGLHLEEARAALLAASAQDDALVQARLAEVEFYLGHIAAANRAAKRAIEASPGLSRPRAILGFAALADNRFAAAEAAFRAAAMRDPADPLPRIGLGLVAIRRGDLATGRPELELAVALDPEGAVFRSYLGKAYAAEKRFAAAEREWKLAQQSDPRDPTPWLYEAFAKRSLNLPAEALADLQQSIARNDNRAVYRSRLLLDQDLATRTADLASVYRDLGFEQAALSEGYKSVNGDPASPAAHRFLSETFLALPRHESASDSELLQSLLLQPLNVNPPRPRLSREGLGIIDLLGPSRVGYNEFSPLFAGDGLGLLTDGFAGDRGTAGGNLLVNGLYHDLSGSVGQFYSRTEGIHANGDLRRRVTDLIFQPALAEHGSLFAEYRYSDLDAGDPQNRFNLTNFNPIERQTDDARQYRVGGRVDGGPGVTFVGVWTGANAYALTAPGTVSLHEHEDANTGEGAVYLTGERFNIIAGGNVFAGRDQLGPIVLGRALPVTSSPSNDHGAWLYGNIAPDPAVRLTLGGHFDELRTIVGRTQFDPKLGLSWDVLPNTTLRAAWFAALKRPLIGDPSLRSGQTIEPTQVAGFNQLFDDLTGSKTRRWGIGVDHKFPHVLFESDTLLAGAEWSQRQLDVPISVTSGPTTTILELGWKERFGRAYLSWLPTERIAVNIALDWERLHRTVLADTLDGFTEIQLLRVPFELRYFDPTGLFGLVRTTLVREAGEFVAVTPPSAVTPGKDTFATVDVGIGWRLPGRAAIATLEAQNLLDSHFHYQDTDPLNPRILARRTILARVTFGL
jgi:tetratricopeptide (TPR) repeat protein